MVRRSDAFRRWPVTPKAISGVLLTAVAVYACAGPTVPPQRGGAGASGAGQAGSAGAAGASLGGSAGSAQKGGKSSGGDAGQSAAGQAGHGASGASGTSGAGASGAAGGSGASAAGASGAAGGSGASAGAAGSGPPPITDAACDFAAANGDCLKCGGTTCVDTHSHPMHCGACGHVCPGNEACRNGVCGPTIVTGGGSYTPGVLANGRVYAWGTNEYWGVGKQTTGTNMLVVPTENESLGGGLVVAVTSDVSCGADALGNVRCVGSNILGQLGNGTIGGPDVCGGDKPPLSRCDAGGQTTLIDGVTELRAGQFWTGGTHVCARRADRTVHCWGDLADSGNAPSMVPTQVLGLPPSAGLTMSAAAHCSRGCDGKVFCWGSSDQQQLGRSTSKPFEAPGQVPDVRVTRLVSAGANYCGIREDRKVVCWGRSGYGELGVLEPTLPIVLDGFSDVVQLGMAYNAVCALDGAGKVACIGHPDNNGSPDPLPEGCTASACTKPVPVKLEDVAELGGGAAVVVARLKDGTYRAWGSNDGQIGNGKAAHHFVKAPEKVLGLPPP